MHPRVIALALVAALVAPAIAAECGNGLLEGGEICTVCPADCTVDACAPTSPTRSVAVRFIGPRDREANGATLLLAYRSRLVSLPGSGADGSVRSRIKDTPADSIVAVNDRDYAVRIVIARATAIPSERIATLEFDSCQGAPPPTAADFSCAIEGCATAFGNVDDCACTVTLLPR